MVNSLKHYVRIIALNLGLTAALLIGALAGIEVYLRLTIPSSSGGSLWDYTLSTKRYKVMKPNARIVAWGSEFRTNQLGFRDRASTLEPKQAGEFRVIVLGDSFTVSAGVDFERIYSSVVEKRLQRRFPEVRVINLAVGGYNIVQYRLVLEEVGRALQPDLIVVGVFPFNDLSNDTYRGNYLSASGQAPPSTTPWYERSYAYQAYGSRVAWRLRALFGPHAALASEPVVDTGKDDNLGALESIFATARKDGVPAVAVLLPNTDGNEVQRAQFAPFVDFCRERSLRCLNLLEVFMAKKIDATAFRLNAIDSHPTAAYHAAVAEPLADYLAGVIDAGRTSR